MAETEASPWTPGIWDRPGSGMGMSNLDRFIDERLESALRDGKSGTHFAWNFNGVLWFDQDTGLFWERISRHHVAVAEVSAPTLRELMEKVNNQYGWE